RTLITSESILTAMIQHNRLVNDALFGLPQQGSTLKGQWTKWKERHFPNKSEKNNDTWDDLVLP
ncbi:MAG: hypothetical protein ABI041_20730, partial [Bdellovibrionia bacterium]